MKKLLTCLGLMLPLVAFLLFSFRGTSDAGALSKNVYSGEDLFTALMLHSQVAAPQVKSAGDYFADYDEITAEKKAAYKDILEEIDRRDPAFFARFKEAITSGDRLRIREGLVAGSKMLQSAGKSSDDPLYAVATYPFIIDVEIVAPYAPYMYTAVVVYPIGPPVLQLGDKNSIGKVKKETSLGVEMLCEDLAAKFK